MKRHYVGDFLVVLVVVLPLLAALPRLVRQAEWAWAPLSGVLTQATGILALSTFLAAAMLSARIPRLDRWFGGLVRIWHFHRLLGVSAFLLVLLHVLLLALAALPFSPQASVNSLFPPLAQWEVWAGWIALALMVAFIAPTFNLFGVLNYQRWKRLHLLSAPALVVALVHGLMFAPAASLWWLLSLLALGAIVWRKGISPFIARKPYRVEGVDSLARDVVELKLAPESRGITWRAGQFVYLTPMEPSLAAGYLEEHPYTIASSPGDDFMRIGIKGVGDATEALLSLQAGARVQVEGPYGTFLHEPGARPRHLWIGGGIGITPFVAGVREWRDGNPQQTDVTLLYLANRPDRAYYLDEMVSISRAHEGLYVYPHYSSEQGVLTLDYLAERCPDYADRDVYLCGPPGMIKHVEALLHGAGVPRQRIHTEAFDFL